VGIEPFDPLLSFDVLVKAHQRISGRAGASTFPSNALCTPADTVGTSAHGVRVIRNRYLLALQIAASDTASSFLQAGASVSPSWRSACLASLTFTLRISGTFSSVGVDLVSLSFRGLGLLGLTLPAEGCHRSALPLPCQRGGWSSASQQEPKQMSRKDAHAFAASLAATLMVSIVVFQAVTAAATITNTV